MAGRTVVADFFLSFLINKPIPLKKNKLNQQKGKKNNNMQKNKQVYLNSKLILVITRGPNENQFGKQLDTIFIIIQNIVPFLIGLNPLANSS